MKANEINNSSLNGQGSFSKGNIDSAIEPVVEHIESLLNEGVSLQEAVYNLAQETYEIEQISVALEHLGYKPDAIANLFQEIEMAVNEQSSEQQPQHQMPDGSMMPGEQHQQQGVTPIEDSAAQLLNEMQGSQQPSMQLGGMAASAADFGFALKDFIGETKGTKNQHKDGTQGRKRHRWEVDFKGADVNPKDYHVTSKGELVKNKIDPAVSPFKIDTTDLEGAVEYFDDIDDKRKPFVEDFEYEDISKRPASNKIPGNFDEWMAAANAPKGPTEMGEYGPVKKQSMLDTRGDYDNNFQEGGQIYTIKSGDVLSKLAVDNGFSMQDIVDLNPGLKPDKIQIGQKLNLPSGKAAPLKTRHKFEGPYMPPGLSDQVLFNRKKGQFMRDLMIQENAAKKGWDEETQLWKPEKAPEDGGGMDIGYGHKILPNEDFSKGLTNDQVMELLSKDTDGKINSAKRYFNSSKLSATWDELAPEEQILLTDYQYNVGLSKFPKFMTALADKDKEGMLEQYKRFSDKKPLGERNKWTKKYIEDNIDYKYGGDLPIAQFGIPKINPIVTPIPTQPFSSIQPTNLIPGQRFNTAGVSTPVSTPINTDWGTDEDAGAWDQGANGLSQDPTVTRKRTIGTGLSNAGNWLENSKAARTFGSAANVIRAGAGVVNSYFDSRKLAKAEEEQRLSMMADNSPIYTDKEINYAQSAQTGLFGEDTRLAYEVAKYGSEIYRDGGDIASWFEQNNIPRAQEGGELEVDNDMLAALIAAGADIEML